MPDLPDITSSSSNSTSASLIRRVRLKDAGAWKRLVELYGPLVYSWSRRQGLRDSDAADVVQDVFRSVFQALDQFQREHPDANFRGWLAAITRNQVHLFFRRQGHGSPALGGDAATILMQQVPDPLNEDDSTVAESHRLLHRALAIVRVDFNETTWKSFWRMAIEQHPAAEIAADLGLTETSVRQAKFRVLQRLRQELDDRIR